MVVSLFSLKYHGVDVILVQRVGFFAISESPVYQNYVV